MDNLSLNSVLVNQNAFFFSESTSLSAKEKGLSNQFQPKETSSFLFRKKDGNAWISIVRRSSGKVKGYVEREGEAPTRLAIKGLPDYLKIEHIHKAKALINDSTVTFTDYQIEVTSGLKGGMMEEEEKIQEEFVSQHDLIEQPISDLNTRITLKGIPSNYYFETFLKYSELEKQLDAACKTVCDRLTQIIETDVRQKYSNTEELTDETAYIQNFKNAWSGVIFKEYKKMFLELYLQIFINKKISKLKNIPLKNILLKLLDFILLFQYSYQSIVKYSPYGEQNIAEVCPIYKSIFSLFQKTWAVYMKAYEYLTEKETKLANIIREYSLKDEDANNYLFYSRDPNGFLLSVFKPNEVLKFQGQDNIYERAIIYGQIERPYYNEIAALFYHNNQEVELIKNSMIAINNSNQSTDSLQYTFYMGAVENAIATISQCPLAVKKWEGSIKDTIKPSEFIEEEYLAGNNVVATAKMRYIPEACLTFDVAKKYFLTTGKPCLIPVLSTLEQKEVYYTYLLELSEMQKTKLFDSEIQKLIGFIEDYHDQKPLLEIIAYQEKELEDAYTEKFLTENETESAIRVQQEERRDKVANEIYYTQKPKQAASKEKRKYQPQKASNKNSNSTLTTAKLPKEQEARILAKNEIKKLKQNISHKKTFTYRAYKQILNEVIKIVRPGGIDMDVQLNKSSHGYITMTDSAKDSQLSTDKMPHYKPHGQNPSVPLSTLINILDSCMNALSSLSTALQ